MDILDILKVVGGSGGIVAGIGYVLRILFDKRALKHNHKLEIEREMTDKIHRYTEKYYMSLIRSATQAANSLQEKPKDEADPQNIVAFFHLSRHLSVRYNIAKEMEGYFLGDLVIEELLPRIATKAFNKILCEPKKYLSKMDLSQLTKETSPDEFLADFKDKLNKETIKPIFQRYISWKHDREEYALEVARLFNCYSNLFKFGINECYREWYGQHACKLEEDNKEIIKEELKQLRTEELITQAELDRYLRKLYYPPKPKLKDRITTWLYKLIRHRKWRCHIQTPKTKTNYHK